MTRLTDAQIDEVWYATPNLRGFVDAIAALAVQEVEREVVKWQEAHVLECHARNHAEAALAEVTKERNAHREQSRINDEVALCYRRDWQQAKAQLATAKREGFVNGAAWGAKNYLFSVKHQAALANEQASREYPATPSGELCDADCGCQAPEARQVPSVKLSDGRVFEVGKWFAEQDTFDIVTRAGEDGIESRRCFANVKDLRAMVSLPWADWQKIDAAIRSEAK